MLPLLLLAAAPQVTPGAVLIDRGRADRAAPIVKTAPATTKRATSVTAAGAAVPIAGIRFVGAKAPGRVGVAARAFLGKPASVPTLQLLAAALSNAYGRSPVALYTIAIPEQDFAGGIVTVHLVEGRIATVALKADPHAHSLVRARLARLLGEAPLSRATFERQMTLISEMPGLKIDPAFQDPQSTGALALTVTPHQRHHKFSFGFSNRGVDLLGDGQFDATAAFYGLARDGDQLSLSASAARDLRRYRYGSAGYSVPLTPSGLSLTATGAYLETRPQGLPVAGTAKLAGVSLGYPLVRDFHHSADLSLGIDGLDSDNAVFGNVVATERTRAVRAAASWSVNREKRGLSVSGSVSQGLDVAGARTTQSLSEPVFLKGTAAASVAQQIGNRVVARLSASGQYSGNRLPAAERYSIGGEAIGRAFDTAVLTGDRGAGGLAELAFRPLRKSKFAQSEVYSFVDGGVVGVLPRGDVPRLDYSLASAGVGVRARYNSKAEIGLEAAHAIDDPYPAYPDDWRVSVEYRLTL